MRRLESLTVLMLVMAALLSSGAAAAQDDGPVTLTASEPTLERGLGIYGQEVLSAVGSGTNQWSSYPQTDRGVASPSSAQGKPKETPAG